ncbi:hypothetical protein ACFQQB_35545 [Nonomuraea rubra]|uniref:hypothetical protein n=1 Tax=Nonomuraea rubra TaxID=46180 RepID=UPI003607B8EE
MRPFRLALAALLLTLCATALLTGTLLAGPAQARTTPARADTATALHPLGRFTVNHYNGLRVAPGQVRNLAVVDLAELPTLQAKPEVDAAYAGRRCAALAGAQRLEVAGRVVPWRVTSSTFAYAPGEGDWRPAACPVSSWRKFAPRGP